MEKLKNLSQYVGSVIAKASVENSSFGVKQMLAALKKIRSTLSSFAEGSVYVWVSPDVETPEEGTVVAVSYYGEYCSGRYESFQWYVERGDEGFERVHRVDVWLKELK